MVKLVGNDSSKIKYLENKLIDNNYHFQSGGVDKDYRTYQLRVFNYLVSQNVSEQKINSFFAEVDNSYTRGFPSESELDWYRNDPRASLWLACELYEKLKEETPKYNIYFLSPAALQPDHNVRVEAIRHCMDEWPMYFTTPGEFIKDKSIEWAELLDQHDLFRSVRSSKVDVCSWLRDYLRRNTSIGLKRICGSSPEEIMSWCYASYFMWRKDNLHSPDSVELFARKFKSAWSTQKNRNKNKEEKKLVTMSVNISQQAHDMLRDMSIKDTMSNNAIIESAILRLYKSKNTKVHSK
ncbi:hypothetical protein [Citrobacter farmeri]|uniref:hypothetical protein n=1 Tax=Citrobacter farmeri TaxID=67824 RepID=UPI001896B487|nr:hypothetical protein [Citrobacter farmeri]MDB2170258.1 hypothetical protein [Citrobacter farmeri]